MVHPQFVHKPALSVIGLEAAFISVMSPDATNAKVIGPLWEKFLHQAKLIPNRIGDAMIGLIYGRPEAERTHPHESLYLAGVPVSSSSEIPTGMVGRTIAPGTFAVFTHRGPITTIGDTVAEIYRVWLPNSAYEHAHIADVELYDQRFNCESDTSEMEYWISVIPKASAQ